MREKVGKSRNTVFFQWFVAPEGRKVGSLKRRVRSQLARWVMKNCTPLWLCLSDFATTDRPSPAQSGAPSPPRPLVTNQLDPSPAVQDDSPLSLCLDDFASVAEPKFQTPPRRNSGRYRLWGKQSGRRAGFRSSTQPICNPFRSCRTIQPKCLLSLSQSILIFAEVLLSAPVALDSWYGIALIALSSLKQIHPKKSVLPDIGTIRVHMAASSKSVVWPVQQRLRRNLLELHWRGSVGFVNMVSPSMIAKISLQMCIVGSGVLTVARSIHTSLCPSGGRLTWCPPRRPFASNGALICSTLLRQRERSLPLFLLRPLNFSCGPCRCALKKFPASLFVMPGGADHVSVASPSSETPGRISVFRGLLPNAPKTE